MVDVADDAVVGVNHNEDQSRGFTVGDGGISATGKGHRID